MKSPIRKPLASARMAKQRGVALFFALICMVAIMLAAVILVRSVDTAALITGNLAFQQSATRSGDAGTEAAIKWLADKQALAATQNVLTDPTHPMNLDDAAAGYYASLDPAKSLTAAGGFLWTGADSAGLAEDSSGNTVRYIIQRMCRTSGVAVNNANCFFSAAALDNNGQNIPLPQEVCSGPGCPVAGQTPLFRVTSRTAGPKNTLSYVQAIVY
jgi:Tfp pilus assembly protein PilX